MDTWEWSLQASGTAVTREEAGYPHSSEKSNDPQGSEKIRTPGKSEGTRGPQDNEGIKGPKETENTRDSEEAKKIRDMGETWKIRGPGESEGIRDPGETEGIRGPGETEGIRGPREPWNPEKVEVRDPEEYKEMRTPDESEVTWSSKGKRGAVKFDIEKLEKSEKSWISNSSQETWHPKETGDSEGNPETRDLEEEEEVKAMAEKGCLSLTKYFLFVFNVFFFVLGSLVFCFGLWILIDKNSFASFLGLSFTPLKIWSYVLATSGVLTGLLSLLGCLGALKEIRCLLGLYFGLLLLLFTTQITVGVLIYTQHGLLERKVREIVLDVIENYHKYPSAYSTAENWDFVQFQLRCCGWNSPQDWLLASSLRSNGSAPSGPEKTSTSNDFQSGLGPRVPCSCQNTSVIPTAPQSPADVPRASQPAVGAGTRAAVVVPGPGNPVPPARYRSGELCWMSADSGVYQEGCFRSIYTWLHNNLISIVGISLGLGLLELGVMSLSMFLCRNLDHVYDKLSRYS
ncbi:leukocyte antigen CD37 isoform X2 [Macrotis lagotis]|uniref:leukocyte antigen CD37 isoform X2 n=1 Tax=Macrotis lagotis TaxID=92651 RepID=UPI003D69571A